ncbi:MAG: signal peptide peptidase SppA [Planctomycetota bacterium]
METDGTSQAQEPLGGPTPGRVETPPVQRLVIEAAPPRRRSIFWRIVSIGFIAFIVIAIVGNLAYLTEGMGPGPVLNEAYIEGKRVDPDRIAVIDLSGPIFEYGGTYHGPVEVLSEAFRKAAADDRVRTLILEVNSPGGGVTASDELVRKMEEFQRGGRKVVVLMKDIAASGGYYVSAGADSIIAQPTTVTGSIGVIIASFNYKGLADWAGVKQVTFKSGAVKDILSPMRDVTEEETKLIQEIVEAMFRRFKEVVMRGRKGKMTEADFEQVADGRILTAEQAKELHLIDGIGYLGDAIAEAKRLAGAPQASVVRYWRKPGLAAMLLAARSEMRLFPWEAEARERRSWSPFLYMWLGPQ